MVASLDQPDAPWCSLADLVAAQASRTPHRAALIAADGRPVSYGELAARTSQLARVLIARGVGTDRIVPILLDRSVEMIVATLAVLTAGGCYMPIDPETPAARLAVFLSDSGADFILSSRVLAASPGVPEDLEVLCLDDPALVDACAHAPSHPVSDQERSAPIQPQDLAFIIYTSGSTGPPKGSGNTQLGIVNCLGWLTAEMGLGPDVRALQQTTYSFDMSLLEIFLPLINGGALVLLRPGGHRDLSHVTERIQTEAVSLLFFVPNMLMEFLRSEQAGRCTSLRHLVAAGEKLSAHVAVACHEALPGATLWNGYGPSETAVLTNLWRCRREDGMAPPPIGHAAWNTELFILDDAGQPVADGAVGELYIAGAHVSRGYLHRPEMTAKAFLDCPFGPPGRTMYRTGDAVERRPDGALMFHGRGDSQIKLNGVRIELGEIEALLAKRPGVGRAAVVARELAGETRLVAYLIAAPGAAEIGAGELRRTLAERLPLNMIPSHFVYVDQFPTTTSGKLLARALPDPAMDGAAISGDDREASGAPVDPLAATLAELFAQVTGGERVSIHHDFFELGGTSLTAVRLSARLKRETGHVLPLRDLMEHPTPARLAKALRQSSPGAAAAPEADPRPTVFLFGGAGGHGRGLVDLRQAAADRLDIRPIDYPNWRSLGGPTGFDRMLKSLAFEAATLAPTGPLRLVGYSLGGLVAYGVALELAQLGRPATFVGLLDSEAPVAPTPPVKRPAPAPRGAERPRFSFSRLLWSKLLRTAPVSLLKLGWALSELAPMNARDDFERDLNDYVVRGLTERWQHDRRRLTEKLASPLVLFRVRDVGDEEHVYDGWPFRSDQFQMVMIDGDHFGMFDPGKVDSLAAKLERAIRDAEE